MNTHYSFSGTQWQEEFGTDVAVLTDKSHKIIVWNDNVNTFEWVIDCLMDICCHSHEQAEQCALIIHHAGKYAVKKGDFETLRPQAEGLIDRGISATIE